MALQPNSGLGNHNVEVSRSHTHTRARAQAHVVELLWKSYQLFIEAATCTTHNKHETDTHAFNGIRNRSRNNEVASDLHIR